MIRFIVAVWLMAAFQAVAVDAYPTDRRTGLPDNLFTNAGVRLGAGIPAVSTVFTQMNSGHTLAAINGAISSCPSNQVVGLDAGTYNFTGSRLQIVSSGKVVRGATNAAGYPTTIITNADLRIGSDLGPAENWANVTAINITNGLTAGSTSIQIASSSPGSDFVVGDVILIDQTFDGTLVKDSSTDFAHRPSRPYCQVVRITSMTAPTINFEPPLLGAYWSGAQDPEAVAWSSQVGGTFKMSGFENLVVDMGSASGLYTIVLGRAAHCWLKNVFVTGWPSSGGSAGVRVMWATSCSAVDGGFYDGPTASSSAYAIYPSPASYLLVQNNIFTNLGLGMPVISAVGCVFAYNVGLPPFPYSPDSFLAEYFFPHGGHSHDSIYEGNWLGSTLYMDAIFGGNNSYIGVVRNRIQGWATGKSGNLIPITLEADMDEMTILGNVLGMPGIQDIYPDDIVDSAVSVGGLILTNNYNTVSNGIPTGETIGSNTMLDSYIYPSKPVWFGVLPYPGFVSSSGSTYTNINSFTNIPAGHRAFFGEWPAAEAGSESGVAAGAFGSIKAIGNVKLQGSQ